MKPLDEPVKSSLLGIVEVVPVETGMLWALVVVGPGTLWALVVGSGTLWAHVVGTSCWLQFAFVSGSSLGLVVVASWDLLAAAEIYTQLLLHFIFYFFEFAILLLGIRAKKYIL